MITLKEALDRQKVAIAETIALLDRADQEGKQLTPEEYKLLDRILLDIAEIEEGIRLQIEKSKAQNL